MTKSTEPTLTDKAISYLRIHGKARVIELAQAVFNNNIPLASAYVQRMKKDHLIEKVKHGVYRLSFKGQDRIGWQQTGNKVIAEVTKEVSPTRNEIEKIEDTAFKGHFTPEEIRVLISLMKKHGAKEVSRMTEVLKETLIE